MTERPVVVLLHGLLRSARSMARLARVIESGGYETWSGDYPSHTQSIEASAAHIASMISQRHPGRRLLLVTHSLGGILARFLAGPLAQETGLDVRGVVMLAPPNGGSALARRLAPLRIYRRVYGPAGSELASVDLPPWPLPEVPIAIIAGTRELGLNPVGWLSTLVGLLPRDQASDGTVLVSETKLPAMTDFQTVHATHTFIMDHPDVRRMVLRFLETGRLR